MKLAWMLLVMTMPLATAEQKYEGRTHQFLDSLFDSARQNGYRALLGQSKEKIKINKARNALWRFQDVIPQSTPFFCDTNPRAPGARSPVRPTSVHRLRPGDIDVVGTIGDSLSTGNGAGAANLLQAVVEFRGIAWSAGGDSTWREFLTLPNILKEFNPNLVGYSQGVSIGSKRESHFNVAEPIGMTRDLVFQGQLFERRMKSDKRVNFEEDWKLLTIQMGHNEFCSFMCYQNWTVLPDEFRTNLIAGLDYLHDHIPRLLVNLVPPINIGRLVDMPVTSLFCDLLRVLSCTCFLSAPWKQHVQEFRDIVTRCQDVYFDVVRMERFTDKEDFAVVFQPFMYNASFVRHVDNRTFTDMSYFSTDCFHPSQKAHALLANSLWNNMLEPVGKKSFVLAPADMERFLCPSHQHPYIFTWKNSEENFPS